MWEAFFAFHICIGICVSKFLRGQIAQGAVWAYPVVIDPPVFDGLAGVVQSQEPVLVQAFLAELAMERLDVAVLHGTARRDEMQRDLVFVSPLIQRLGGELGAMVDD